MSPKAKCRACRNLEKKTPAGGGRRAFEAAEPRGVGESPRSVRHAAGLGRHARDGKGGGADLSILPGCRDCLTGLVAGV